MRRTMSQLFDDMLSAWKRDEAEQFAASLERFTTMLEQRKCDSERVNPSPNVKPRRRFRRMFAVASRWAY